MMLDWSGSQPQVTDIYLQFFTTECLGQNPLLVSLFILLSWEDNKTNNQKNSVAKQGAM